MIISYRRHNKILGAIAQLGERLNGIQEVGGSIPPGSTKFSLDPVGIIYTKLFNNQLVDQQYLVTQVLPLNAQSSQLFV